MTRNNAEKELETLCMMLKRFRDTHAGSLTEDGLSALRRARTELSDVQNKGFFKARASSTKKR